MPWLGGAIASNNGVVLSGIATRDFWRTTLDVKKPTTTLFPDLDPTDGGRSISSTTAVERRARRWPSTR